MRHLFSPSLSGATAVGIRTEPERPGHIHILVDFCPDYDKSVIVIAHGVVGLEVKHPLRRNLDLLDIDCRLSENLHPGLVEDNNNLQIPAFGKRLVKHYGPQHGVALCYPSGFALEKMRHGLLRDHIRIGGDKNNVERQRCLYVEKHRGSIDTLIQAHYVNRIFTWFSGL